MSEERWADIEDQREQIEAMLGMRIYDWQWDYFQHFQKGERLVAGGRGRYRWVRPDDEHVFRDEEPCRVCLEPHCRGGCI